MDHIRFDAGETTLIISCTTGMPPSILYWGKRITSRVRAADIERLGANYGGPGSADCAMATSLAMEPGLGNPGLAGFSAHRQGQDWGSRFVVIAVEGRENGATLICADDRTQMTLRYSLFVDPERGIIRIGAALTNAGAAVLDLTEMATACLPVPGHMTDIISFSGRWAGEFRRERLTRFNGGYLRENRRGRTSHDSFPAVILCARATTESTGEAYGIHLAWSGNHRIRVDSVSDGRVFASLGALLLSGEVRLAPGETYHSPDIVAGYSTSGLSGLSRHFHDHVRTSVLRPSTRARPRLVHYNSWEAIYFNHDIDQLKAIATRAADLGVERFVLDDGWFGARRNDQAGLGDWTVSRDVYPQGLTPLVDHVRGLGMEMGIWLEPEMVNPDSDLFRAHPDWILRIDGINQIPFRGQYVLDISRADVADYLFTQIDALLSAHAITYIKWDMNRDLNHPGDTAGYPRSNAQVGALYALIDRVRAAYPHIDIESCASGGGRADFGILAHTDRVWTSDTNDAVDRQAIQRGASFFLPLDVIGAHVGPAQCHITGRTVSMGMRAGTALMGHMGLELNVLTEAASDLAELAVAVTLYKRHRSLLHSGDLHRLDTADSLNAISVVGADRSEAIMSVAWLAGHPHTQPERLYWVGLDPEKNYHVRLIWPAAFRALSLVSIVDTLDLHGAGAWLSGEALMTVGLQLPVTVPQTVLLFHLTTKEA